MDTDEFCKDRDLQGFCRVPCTPIPRSTTKHAKDAKVHTERDEMRTPRYEIRPPDAADEHRWTWIADNVIPAAAGIQESEDVIRNAPKVGTATY